MVKKINKKVLESVENGTRYDGCTFRLEFIERVKGSTFSNCKFDSEGVYIELVENCRFMNCAFPELTIEALEKTTIKGGHVQCLRLSDLLSSDDDFEFIQTNNIKELHIDGCDILHIPPAVLEIKNLFKLYLSENEMISIPSGIDSLSNLTELYLDNNSIKELPPQIGKLKKLSILVLSSNNLENLPQEIGNLEKLSELYIENNHISEKNKEIIRDLLPKCDIRF